MKTGRIIFYVLLAATLFLALLTGLRELYLLFFTMLFIVIVAAALSVWTILSFAYTQKVSDKVSVKGARPTLSVSIYNDKPFPLTMMTVEVEAVTPDERQTMLINLDPKDSTEAVFTLTLPYRGEFYVGLTRVYVQDIFGIFPIRFDMRSLGFYTMQKIIVYPYSEPVTAQRSSVDDSMFFNGMMTKGSEEGESFAYTRQYHPGDSMKRIHWKASMRARELFTKQYDVPLETSCMVLVDNRAEVLPALAEIYPANRAKRREMAKAPGADPNLFGKHPLRGKSKERYIEKLAVIPQLEFEDVVCETAADLCRYLLSLEKGMKLFCCNIKNNLESGESGVDFDRLYDYVAMLTFKGIQRPAEVLRTALADGELYSNIYIISNRAEDDLVTEMRAAVNSGINVTFIGIDDIPYSSLPKTVRTLQLSYGDNIAERLGDIL